MRVVPLMWLARVGYSRNSRNEAASKNRERGLMLGFCFCIRLPV